jgi:hypothetical protein
LNIGNRSDAHGLIIPCEEPRELESAPDKTPDLNSIPVLSNPSSNVIPENKSKPEETKKENFTSYCTLYG